DAHAVDIAAGNHHRRSHVHQGEVPHVAVAHFFEIKLRARKRGGNPNGGEKVSGLKNIQARDIDLWSEEVIFRIHSAFAFRRLDNELRIKRNERGSSVGRMDSHASIGAEDGVLAIAAYRRVGIANVAARAIAGPAV